MEALREVLEKIRKQYRGYRARKSFEEEFHRFDRLAGNPARFSMEWSGRLPCLDDKTEATGFDRHYVYHLAWAARVVSRCRPAGHVDISSSLFFCSMLSAFVPVSFYDFRPADLQLDNLRCDSASLLELPFADNSIESLSCMHVVEHVGLGRYGDPLDPDGDLKAVAELTRVLGKGGNLLFVVPVGRVARVVFNAHRIYTYDQVLGCFPSLDLVEFALVPDDPEEGGIIPNAAKEAADAQSYGCGCFWFRK